MMRKVIEAEKYNELRRKQSKKKYEDVLVQYREKAQRDIAKLNQALEQKRAEIFEEANKEIANVAEGMEVKKDQEIKRLTDLFERRKEEVKSRLIEEVFRDGSS